MAIGQHATSDMLNESKVQSSWNEKSAVQAAQIDRQNLDGVFAKICSPWIRKKSKIFLFEEKIHGVANNSQGRPL
jgi:hypothetical protein